MVNSDKANKEELFEPMRISDISPAILLFYFVAIPILIALWSGVIVLNSSVIKFAVLLFLAAVTFGVIRSCVRFFRKL